MPEAKVLQFRRQDPPPAAPPAAPERSYHCSFICGNPDSILRLAQLAADLGVKMYILESPKV